MYEIANRLQSVVDNSKLSARAFAIECGIDPANLGKMMKGNMKITRKTLDKMNRCFPRYNFDWVLTGEGEMLHPAAPQQQNIYNNHDHGHIGDNYIYHGGTDGGTHAAGQHIEIDTAAEAAKPIIPSYAYKMPDYDIYNNVRSGTEGVELLNVNGFFSKIDLIYRVQDNSMMPTFACGDLLGIRKLPYGERIVNGEFYVIDTRSHGARLRILIENNTTYTLRATDENRERYRDFDVNKEDVINIFSVVNMLRNCF